MKRRKTATKLPNKIEEAEGQAQGFYHGWNPDGTREIIEHGVLITPFVPQTWHSLVYGGSKKK